MGLEESSWGAQNRKKMEFAHSILIFFCVQVEISAGVKVKRLPKSKGINQHLSVISTNQQSNSTYAPQAVN